MYLRIHAFVLLLLICRSALSQWHEDWDRIVPELVMLCPNVEVCGKTSMTVGEVEIDDICCRGCSCRTNCSKSRDCCDGTGIEDALSECLAPSTNQDRSMNLYDFVVEPPIEGCEHSQSLGHGRNVTCSPDEVVAPWGNFLPVYSRSLDKNFKNEPCARCHGAEDIDEWTSVLFIDFVPDFVGMLADFFETNDMDDYYVVFNPPNARSTTFEKHCFVETGSCPRALSDSFYVTSNLQMDRESIINACEKGPSAKYLRAHGQAFKNVFCAICNGYASRFSDSIRCEKISKTDLIPPIRVLLDTDYMATATAKQNSAIELKENGNCYRPWYSENETICEGLHCPSLQAVLPTGKCGYQAKFVMIDNLVLCLNLSTDKGPARIDLKKISETQIHELFEKSSPWSKGWFITFIGILNTDSPNWLEFLVCLERKAKQVNMEILRPDIEDGLKTTWDVNLGPLVSLNQALSKHGKTDISYVGQNVTPEWAMYYPNFAADLKPPYWESLFDRESRMRSALHFNQMFLCEQIQLQPDEYEHDGPGSILNLTYQQNYLYPNEFTSLIDVYGYERIRVCLKDSGYVKVVSHATTYQGMMSCIFLSFICYRFIGMVTYTA